MTNDEDRVQEVDTTKRVPGAAFFNRSDIRAQEVRHRSRSFKLVLVFLAIALALLCTIAFAKLLFADPVHAAATSLMAEDAFAEEQWPKMRPDLEKSISYCMDRYDCSADDVCLAAHKLKGAVGPSATLTFCANMLATESIMPKEAKSLDDAVAVLAKFLGPDPKK